MFHALLKTALFKGIAEENIRDVAEFSEFVSYQPGEKAIFEGEHGQHSLLLLTSGEVNVGTRFSPLPTSMELTLHSINSEIFGEVAWILRGEPSAGVTCKGHCEFIRINGDKLFEYCQSNPAIGLELITRIASVLAQRVIHLTEQTRNKELFS